MTALLLAPLVLQAVAMLVDERAYHRRRGLPRWERVGHPLDTMTALLCYAWLVALRPSYAHGVFYGGLAAVSCAIITKDEGVHAELCSPGEHWVHALLFLLHPVVLGVAAYFWWTSRLRPIVVAELVLTAALATYQVLYWNLPWRTGGGGRRRFRPADPARRDGTS